MHLARGLARAAPRSRRCYSLLSTRLAPRLRATPLRSRFAPQHSTIAAPAEVAATTGDAAIAAWLFGCAGMVCSMVVVGGLTRLTHSGLSMVKWKPQGGLPPASREDWAVEFELYKTFPEWKLSDKLMTLSEFKGIYLLEWAHRMLGRTIGVAFAVPLAYFVARRRIGAPLARRLGVMFTLGGAQGAIGWWMVRSGLHEKTMTVTEKGTAHVHPRRLATHLSMAFLLYTLLLDTALGQMPSSAAAAAARGAHFDAMLKALPEASASAARAAARNVRLGAIVVSGSVATTIVFGAFVAGNDAGHAFNDWPMYAERWFPEGAFELTPLYRNIYDNSGLCQFCHRSAAYFTVAGAGAVAYAANSGAAAAALPLTCRRFAAALGFAALAQASMGVATLMLYVPIPLAAAHQAGSVVVWTCALGVVRSLRFLPK